MLECELDSTGLGKDSVMGLYDIVKILRISHARGFWANERLSAAESIPGL